MEASARLALVPQREDGDEVELLEEGLAPSAPRTQWTSFLLVTSVVAMACIGLSWHSGIIQVAARGVLRLEDDVAPPAADALECSAKGEDCSKSMCCNKDGLQCFQKNEFWASCNATCEPGVHAEEDNMGWTCNVLMASSSGAAPAPSGACSVDNGEDCSHTKCCQDPDTHCWEKNEFWATCMIECAAGVHEEDEDKKPWSCKQLLPAMKDTTTTQPADAMIPPAPAPPQGPPSAGPPVTCDGGELPQLPKFSGYEGPTPMFVKVLSYNLFWWNLFGVRKGNGNSAGKLIQSTNSPLKYDLMGFQECENGQLVVGGAQMLSTHEVFTFDPLTKTTAICMAYRRESLKLIARGQDWVGEDAKSQYFGKRALQWMRLTHLKSGKQVFFMNHHGPLPVDSGGKCGGKVTAFHILRAISTNAKPGDAIIVTGDFNADPGSDTLKTMSARITDFVPAGIDNIFSNLPVGSLVRNMDIGDGGSDHNARLAVFQLGKVVGGAAAPTPAPGPPPAPYGTGVFGMPTNPPPAPPAPYGTGVSPAP